MILVYLPVLKQFNWHHISIQASAVMFKGMRFMPWFLVSFGGSWSLATWKMIARQYKLLYKPDFIKWIKNVFWLLVLQLSAVNLPGGEHRRRSAEDELSMRTYLQEGDLISAEVQNIYSDGAVSLHTRLLVFLQFLNFTLDHEVFLFMAGLQYSKVCNLTNSKFSHTGLSSTVNYPKERYYE